MLEIEHKLLVLRPPPPRILAEHAVRVEQIEQRYLKSEPGSSRRIRHIRSADQDQFVLTEKRPVRSGVRAEDERPLDAEAYARLSGDVDPDSDPIRKTRYVTRIPDGLTLVVDVFIQPQGLTLAEVELPDEGVRYQLPDWLGPTRDVTDDERYANAALARNGVPSV